MGLLLTLSQVYIPKYFQKRSLDELLKATADAFYYNLPQMEDYSLDRYLVKYALFTSEKAQESIKRGNDHEVKQRLYYNAFHIGQNLREELRVRTLEDLMQACRVIYKVLKIEFRGNLHGQVHIQSCFFSSFYSRDVCRIISSLDKGLVAGLSGGLGLEFSQRITEGNDCCRAQLLEAGSSL